VTARIPFELKQKIESLNINITKVFRDSLIKAVEEAEALKIQQGLGKSERARAYKAYRDDKLTPESRTAMDNYRKTKLNLWEIQHLANKNK
jgi:hypothetical protein